MLVEQYIYKSVSGDNTDKKWEDMTSSEKNMLVVSALLYILFIMWALIRASKADNKPLHLLFAIISPSMYLIFSYFVDGFYP